MLYVFVGGEETVKVRTTDTGIMVSSSKTNHQFIPITPELFRPNRNKMAKAKLMLSKWPRLSSDERNTYILLEFAKMGYKLQGWHDERGAKQGGQ